MQLDAHLSNYNEFISKIKKILEIKDLDKLRKTVDELIKKSNEVTIANNLDT